MKIATTKKYVSAIAVAAIVLSGGALYTLQLAGSQSPIASAYTSATNPQDPATAPNTYVVNIPDANLKAALNDIIAKAQNADRKSKGLPEDVVRTATQEITAGDMKFPIHMYGALGMNNKGITNIEGLQFLVNASRIDMVGNQITDLSPLRDLPKVRELGLARNRVSDVAPLVTIPNLTKVTLDANATLSDISPLATAPRLKQLHIPYTKVTNIAPVAQIATLEELHINNLAIAPAKIDLAPLAVMPKLKLINANTNRLTAADFAVLKDTPALETLMTAGNNVTNLQDLLKDGFVSLKRYSTFSDQNHAIDTTTVVFPNPIRGVDGEVVPVVETVNVQNVDADGVPNPQGTHIKLVDVYNKGRLNIRWEKNFTKNQVTDRPFSGNLTVNYTLPPKDTDKPVFNTTNPTKIVLRKGMALVLDRDISAADAGSGLTAAGVTHNAAAIGLDINNPAPGNYTVTYSATDNAGNTATLDRQVEITDADALRAKVDAVTDSSLNGYTRNSRRTVNDKKTAAVAVINKNDATQAQIDQALAELNDAIAKLEVDTRKLVAAVTNRYNAEPGYIQQDPAVQTALAEANRVLNDPAKTPASVDKAARDMIKALEDAKQVEADRQTQAAAALAKAEQDKTPSAIADAKAKVAAIKDPAKRAELEPKVTALETEYTAKKNELQQLIDRAQDPATTNGASQSTKDALTAALQAAQAVNGQADAAQADIQQAITDLQEKIAALRPDKSALQLLVNSVPNEVDAVRNDPEVVAQLAAANAVLNDPAATADTIRDAQTKLQEAIDKAKVEQQRQAEARTALDTAATPGNQSPVYFDAAQAKIDAVQDPAKKAAFQKELDDMRAVYSAKLNELRQLINESKKPEVTDGMTVDSVTELAQALNTAEAPGAQGDVDLDTYNVLIKDIRDALAQLTADKKPLADAENTYNGQPDYIKNNPAVQSAFRRAQDTRALVNPSVKDVRDNAKALEDAITAVRQTETNAQQAADTGLRQAEAALNAPLQPHEMPAIDIAALEAQVAAVQDPVRRSVLQAELDALKTKLADRQKQVDAYNQSEEGKRAEAERQRQAREAAERAKNSEQAKGHGLADTGAAVAAPVVGGLGAVIAGVWALIRRKRQ